MGRQGWPHKLPPFPFGGAARPDELIPSSTLLCVLQQMPPFIPGFSLLVSTSKAGREAREELYSANLGSVNRCPSATVLLTAAGRCVEAPPPLRNLKLTTQDWRHPPQPKVIPTVLRRSQGTTRDALQSQGAHSGVSPTHFPNSLFSICSCPHLHHPHSAAPWMFTSCSALPVPPSILAPESLQLMAHCEPFLLQRSHLPSPTQALQYLHLLWASVSTEANRLQRRKPQNV